MPLQLIHPPPRYVALAFCISLLLFSLAAARARAFDPPVVEAGDAEPAPADAPEATADDEPQATVGDENDGGHGDGGAPSDPPAVASDDEPGAEPEPQSPRNSPRPAPAEQPTPTSERKDSDQPQGDPPSNDPTSAGGEATDPSAPAALPKPPADAEPLAEAEQTPSKPKIPLEPASLEGVHPGKTTRDELHERWGVPLESQRVAGGAREAYRLEKLGKVRATIAEDVVVSLALHVERPLPVEEIAGRLNLGAIESVELYDEQGEILGAAYPERGVLLGYMPKTNPPRVFQVVVESIDAQPFLARAESRLKDRYADCLSDVEIALGLAPELADAHRMKAEISLRRGKLQEALESAEKAAHFEPEQPRHLLLLARAFAAAGDYQQAIARVRDVLDNPNTDDLVAAHAWCQSGDYLARSAKRDFGESIKHHQQAIRLAEPLAASKDGLVRAEAKQLLLDAHLAVAYDIGWGKWQQKDRVVPKWIERSAVLADDLMRKERFGPEVRLQVYMGALAALAGASEPPDASKWIDGTRQLGRKIYDGAKDPEYRAHLSWQLGQALSHAVEIETLLQRSDEAFRLGALARSLLDEGQTYAAELPTSDYERGRLCYRVGVIYALERGDHAQAVVWFDRATPLLERPVPAAAIDPGAQGETFVSMGVSYWEQKKREEALRLTSQGLKMMESAVGEGSLEAAALAVPYNNLSAMHEALGDNEQARWCADLATRYEQAAQAAPPQSQ